MTLAHYTSWHPPWDPFARSDRGGDLADRPRGQALHRRGRGGRDLSGGDHACGLRAGPRRSAVRPVGHTVLLGPPHQGPGGPVGRLPLALFMFIGWENGPALAEESRDPRRTIPRALYISVAIAAALLVLFAYATVTGFRYNVSSIGRSSVPFLTVADHYLGPAGLLAWIAGIVSVLATLVAGADSSRACSSTADGPDCFRPGSDTCGLAPRRRSMRWCSWRSAGWERSESGGLPVSSPATPAR